MISNSKPKKTTTGEGKTKARKTNKKKRNKARTQLVHHHWKPLMCTVTVKTTVAKPKNSWTEKVSNEDVLDRVKEIKPKRKNGGASSTRRTLLI